MMADSAYDSTIDSDNNSFSFGKNYKHLGFSCLHNNAPQACRPPLATVPPHTSASLCEDEITTTIELFSDDSDSGDSYFSNDSNDDLLSLDSVIRASKPSCNRSDDGRKFNDLSSFPSFQSSFSHTNALERYEASSLRYSMYRNKSSILDSSTQCSQTLLSLSHDRSHDSNNSLMSVNDLEDNCVPIFRDRIVSCPSFSALDNNLLTSSTGVIPSAVIFANECLKRSIARRSSDASPSNLSIGTTDNSMRTTHLVALQKLSSVVPSLITPQKSGASSSIVFYEVSKTIQLVESMLEDMSLSFYTSSLRLQEIKKRLRSIEIKYYRRKCVWSLRKSMAYLKFNEDSDISSACDDSSICSEISVSRHNHQDRNLLITQIFEIAWEVMCVNLVIAMVYMFYLFYEDSLDKFSEMAKIRRQILGLELEDDII